MHLENVGKQPKIDKNVFETAKANEIQRNLIIKSGEDPMEWIGEKAGDFRKIIANPDLGLYEMYINDPGAAEKYIEDKLEEIRQSKNQERTLH